MLLALPLLLIGPRVECKVFLLSQCPVANAYAPEIQRIGVEYGRRGVRFRLVYADPGLSLAAARRHAKEYGYTLPLAVDPRGEEVRRHKAARSPEAVVLRDGRTVYQGRIDDRYASWGVKRPKPRSRDLRAALDAALAGRPPPVRKTESVGCLLPRAVQQ